MFASKRFRLLFILSVLLLSYSNGFAAAPAVLQGVTSTVQPLIVNQSGNTIPVIAVQPVANTPPAVALGNTLNARTNTMTAHGEKQSRKKIYSLAVPRGLQAKAGGNKVLLAWEPIQSGANSKVAYHVFRGIRPVLLPEDVESWPEPLNKKSILKNYFMDAPGKSRIPPVANQQYYYNVMAVDAQANRSPLSAPLKVLNAFELSTPVGFKGSSQDQAILLSWGKAFSGGQYGLAGYRVFRSATKNRLGKPVLEKLVQETSYLDQGTAGETLVNTMNYFYTLFAEDVRGNRSLATDQIMVMPFVAAGIPTYVTATGKTDDVIELQWRTPEGGTFKLKGYNIYRKSDQEQTAVKINKTLVSSTIYRDSEQNSTVKPILGRYYTYTLRAVDEKGNEGAASAIAQANPRAPIEIPASGLISTSIPGLPPESSLTISGKKKIDISYTEVIALKKGEETTDERYPSITSGLSDGFNLEQELQVRLQGKVGKKISVDVDYDDTKEEQQKISIIYAGDPDDVVQEAAFGDILLDLPRTEFAGYNKNLFGAKIKVALDKFRFTAIGAQTKGITVTEKFKGNTSARIIDKQDISFTPFKYYYLTKDATQVNHPDLSNYNATEARHGIVPGSDIVYVTNGVVTAETINTTTASGHLVKFNKYSPGVDYSVDYERGILSFNSTIQQTWMIALAYKYYDAAGTVHTIGYTAAGDEFDWTIAGLQVPTDGLTSDNAHLIQDYNSTTNERSYIMMLMNRYSLGYQNIKDPQSDPDFVIKVFSTSGSERFIPQPSDTKKAEEIYKIDPTFGTIEFRHNYPFKAGTTDFITGTDVYADDAQDAYSTLNNPSLSSGGDSGKANKYYIHIEFKNLITTFQLANWNVIKNSEIIKKDGAKMQRNTDYYIDYDTGFITFLNPESIASTTEITVTYEYLPFGSNLQSNLFGARAEYDIIEKKLSIGSTFLYNASQTPQDVPDVNSTPTSLMLIDGDAKFNLNPEDFGEWSLPYLGKFKVPVTIDVSAEVAYSSYAVNTYRKAGEDGVAMIDSMEGSDNILSLPVSENANNIWFPTSRPSTELPENRRYVYLTDAFETGRVPVDSNDKSHQMRWYYSDMTADTWDGFIYPLSSSGSNLNDYNYIEMSIYSNADAAHPVVLRVDLGVLSEDSNGNGNLNFEGDRETYKEADDVGINNYMTDPYSIPPKIAVDPSGVAGIYPTDAPTGYWGDGNTRLNNEDLDNDDLLDTQESYYEYEVTLEPGEWKLYKISLKDFTAAMGNNIPTLDTQSETFLSYVKHVRLWVSGVSGDPSSNYFQIESMRLTGNKWQAKGFASDGTAIEPAASTINASAISLVTDDNYLVNKNFYVYDENNADEELRNERALKLEYNLDSSAMLTNTVPAYFLTRTLTTNSAGYNYSNYQYLRMDVYKKTITSPGEILFVRLAIDQNNYYQYAMSLDDAPVGTWHTFKNEMNGSDGKRISVFQTGTIVGLTKIKEISIGIINPNTVGTTEEIWLNNLRVTEAKQREGIAMRLSSSTRLADIFTVSTDLRDIASDFYTIDETPSGKQHTTSNKVTGNLTKFSTLPVNATWSRTNNYTELEHRPEPYYSNNFATPDTVNETVSGNLSYLGVPGLTLGLNATQSRQQTAYIDQIYNVNNEVETLNAIPSVSYTLPGKILNVPIGSTTFTGKYEYIDSHTRYDEEKAADKNRSDLWSKWKHSKNETYTYVGSYNPIKYLKISPSFTYTQNSDRGYLSWYKFYAALDPGGTESSVLQQRYYSDLHRMASLNKIAKLNVNLLNIPVITPSISYSMTNTRDYVSDTLSVPGSLSWQSGLALGDVIGWSRFPKLNLSQNYTVSATYRNEIGDDKDQPIHKLTFDDLWMIDPVTFRGGGGNLDTAYINSRNLSESVSTNISLIPDVSFTPSYAFSWNRSMSSQQNFSTKETLSYGSGAVWSRIPSPLWMQLQSLNLDYRYSQNKTFDTNEKEISRNTTHTSSATLPFRLFKEISSTVKFSTSNGTNQTGDKLDVIIFNNTYNTGLTMSYNLNMSTPLQLPNFWPFNGAVLKVQQTLRLSNSFDAEFVVNEQENIESAAKETNTYTNDTSIKYSLWKNVEGDIVITNQWFYDKLVDNKDYWAIRIKAGLTAIF
ncbi:hypothetical protein K8S19_02655 [bacterium]|nr:hypothetical protein [bacterium]